MVLKNDKPRFDVQFPRQRLFDDGDLNEQTIDIKIKEV